MCHYIIICLISKFFSCICKNLCVTLCVVVHIRDTLLLTLYRTFWRSFLFYNVFLKFYLKDTHTHSWPLLFCIIIALIYVFRSHFYVIYTIYNVSLANTKNIILIQRESRGHMLGKCSIHVSCYSVVCLLVDGTEICTRTLYLDNSFQLTIYWLKPCRRLNIKIICIYFIIICVNVYEKKKKHISRESVPDTKRLTQTLKIITMYMIILFNGIIIADLILV